MKAVCIESHGNSNVVKYLDIDEPECQRNLIKVKIKASNRIIRNQIVDEICKKISTQLVTLIGGIALIYKKNPETPKIKLPK